MMELSQSEMGQTYTCGSEAMLPHYDSQKPFHRIATVMEQEGVTPRTLARRLGKTVGAVEKQMDPSSDMSLSDLYRWQRALQVPVSELLDESGHALSPPILHRTRLMRLMRTVRSIQDLSTEDSIQRLATDLSERLLEMMPELKEISGWPSVGQRRKSCEMGAIAYDLVPSQLLDYLAEEI